MTRIRRRCLRSFPRVAARMAWIAALLIALLPGAATPDVRIFGGATPQPGDPLLPDVEGMEGVEIRLSETAVETLYPAGPLSIRDESIIEIGFAANTFLNGLEIPSTSGTVLLEAPRVGSNAGNRVQTAGADLLIRGGANFLAEIFTQAADGDGDGGSLRFEQVDPTVPGAGFADLFTDGGSDFDDSGGNDAGDVHLTSDALFLHRISAVGGAAGAGAVGLPAGNGGFVTLVQTAVGPPPDVGYGIVLDGNVSVDSGGEGGLPGSIRIEGSRLLLSQSFTTLAASGPSSAAIPADRGDVSLAAGVVRGDAGPRSLAIDALGEIVFEKTVGVGGGGALDALLVSEARSVRFEDVVRTDLLRTVDAIGGLQFLGGFGTVSEIGELAISASEPVLGRIDVFAAVEIDQAGLHATDRIQVGGANGSASGNGSLTLRGGTVGPNLLVGESGAQLGVLQIEGGSVSFEGLVVNSAGSTVKNTGGVAVFDGGFVNFGAYLSDPADNVFADLTVEGTGYLRGGLGDRFVVVGDLLSSSEASVLWDTRQAELFFVAGKAGESHLFSVGGEDRGAVASGFTGNFAWGTLRLASGELLVFEDKNEPGGALYVRDLLLEDGVDQLALLKLPAGMAIYYDRGRESNEYLGGLDYALPGGGTLLASVPEPAPWVLGLAAWILVMRRSHS